MTQLQQASARRYLLFPFDFDTRAVSLSMEIKEDWEDHIKETHQGNKDKTIARLKSELGESNFELKLQNFIDVGTSPFSLVSYHNLFFHQARYAFYHGYYYPALVAACALGERMLNHMILELRDRYSHTLQYKKVYRKSSFDNWEVPISTLSAWGVFQNTQVKNEFDKLRAIRNKSIHFDMDTYTSLRDDALAALKHISEIISVQFGYGWPKKSTIKGTKGHVFIKKDFEEDPFTEHFILPSCPLVSPYFAINFAKDGILFFDFKDCGFEALSDEEFADTYNSRKGEEVAPSTLPAEDTVLVMKREH